MSNKFSRTMTVLAGAFTTLVVTAAVALADYPPPTSPPHVKGLVVHPDAVSPDRTLAFTGADLLPLMAAVVVLLVAGAALLFGSRALRRRRETQSRVDDVRGAARDELVALEGLLAPARHLQTCHRDLFADNVLGTPDGGVCVIDWENSGPADPSQELACVVFEFARADPGRARALTQAYRDGGGPAAVSRRGHFSMLIAQLGHIIEIAAADWLEPNVRSPERADAAAWIAESLDEPHTRELLATLLAVIRQRDYQ
jgi:hypothetical protein